MLDQRDERFLRLCRACPAFGRDDPSADELATRFLEDACEALTQRTPYLGLAFVPSSIQFVTYADAGKAVQATPDGRGTGDPLADCLGAILGKDTRGVTALLASAAKLCGWNMIGTPVLNVRLSKESLQNRLAELAKGFFELGGMQLQISVVSREDMLDAMDHPERHENLIVRIGGYSEYFTRLSPELQKTVVERTEHIV